MSSRPDDALPRTDTALGVYPPALITAALAVGLALGACGSPSSSPSGSATKDSSKTSGTSAATAAGATTAATATGASAETAVPALAAGDPAPDVTFTLQDGSNVKLAALKGKQVLVYFYPKDDTPGCTLEAQGLRDNWDDVKGAGLVVYGVSEQDGASHQAFIDKHKLPFPLVVDTDGSIARAFHVPLRNGLSARQSFLVGSDGKLAKVWLEVSPRDHASLVLAAAIGS